MTATISINGFWRVGRRVDPLAVRPEYQGDGRFDDPEHLVAVLYAAPTIDTCLLELLRQWPAASNAAIAAGVPEPILPEDALDADVDVKIAAASRRRRIPPYIYERDAVYGESASPLTLLDLTDVITMQRLERDPGVEREMACCGYSQMDRGALLAPIQHRRLTQAITNAVLRGVFADEHFDGVRADSRHGGELYGVFLGGGYDPKLNATQQQPLTAQHPALQSVAATLDLDLI